MNATPRTINRRSKLAAMNPEQLKKHCAREKEIRDAQKKRVVKDASSVAMFYKGKRKATWGDGRKKEEKGKERIDNKRRGHSRRTRNAFVRTTQSRRNAVVQVALRRSMRRLERLGAYASAACTWSPRGETQTRLGRQLRLRFKQSRTGEARTKIRFFGQLRGPTRRMLPVMIWLIRL